MTLEEIWYETSPYVYAVLGVAAFVTSDGTLARLSSALLLVAAGTIVRLRRTYRRERAAAQAAADVMSTARIQSHPYDELKRAADELRRAADERKRPGGAGARGAR